MTSPENAPESVEKTSFYADVPLTYYEVTWQSGHVERFPAHEIAWPGSANNLFSPGPARPVRVQIFAEIDGRWTLQLSAPEEDIRTIRNVTTEEVL